MHRTKIPHTYRDLAGDPILLSVPDPCTPRQLKTAIMDSLQLLSKDEDDELEALYQENLAKMDSSDADDACGFSEGNDVICATRCVDVVCRIIRIEVQQPHRQT